MDTNTSVASRQRATQGAGGIAGDLMRVIMAFLGDGEITFHQITTTGTGANLQLLPDVDRLMPTLTVTADTGNTTAISVGRINAVFPLAAGANVEFRWVNPVRSRLVFEDAAPAGQVLYVWG